MSAVHDGVTPWFLEPRLMPSLPPPWDVTSQFREALRYSLAGAYQGAALTAFSLVLAALGLSLRGALLVPLLLGLPLWVMSEILLVPRPGRFLLRNYATRFPVLWEWSRPAIRREDRGAARGLLLLHALVLAVVLPSAWILWFTASARGILLAGVGTAVVLTAVQLAILASGMNSAGLRVRAARPTSAIPT